VPGLRNLVMNLRSDADTDQGCGGHSWQWEGVGVTQPSVMEDSPVLISTRGSQRLLKKQGLCLQCPTFLYKAS
jgi:hypothetical protein